MTDATGREIVIGKRYTYSQTSNGSFWIVKGTAFKFTETKVTLSDIQEKRGLYGKDRGDFTEETRKRAVYASMLFPIDDFILGDKVTTEYYNHGEVFEVVGIKADELELRGDWSGGTHNADQIGWYDKLKCRLK